MSNSSRNSNVYVESSGVRLIHVTEPLESQWLSRRLASNHVDGEMHGLDVEAKARSFAKSAR